MAGKYEHRPRHDRERKFFHNPSQNRKGGKGLSDHEKDGMSAVWTKRRKLMSIVFFSGCGLFIVVVIIAALLSN